ncbi:3'(2'),5'-bisphosphate nucleotidase CysQ [Fulvitalea axinellae]|uniref:3'(2'),5'-bisphosphate nucleotidase CysQ n=1 Tax=Fulvitalea axinellae TaxID=1182444 RepID=A0AAU9DAR1_9BACT|nr:3'(2'),5'-bisphosphate nucleotidase CysQ [Fulvitalea axinellae]
MSQIKLEDICDIAVSAGQEIMNFYKDEKTFEKVDFKADDSPLTLADQAAHKIICAELEKLYPEIPILSEEGAKIEYAERSKWDRYFLVDPLDGTKEFINRNGEFTVNIAVIENRKAIAGVIYVPVKDTLYFGDRNGAFKRTGNESAEKISVRPRPEQATAVRSKSHASNAEESVLERYNVTDSISVGSSLKFCMVAEGKADVYYRHGPTMEWDTGAGQAVLEAAGGKVYTGSEENEVFLYNKENLLNGSFLAIG